MIRPTVFLALLLPCILHVVISIKYEDTTTVQNKCFNDTKVEHMIILSTLLTGKNMDDINFKKFVNCIYKEHHFINANNNTINSDAVRQYNMLFHSKEVTDAIMIGCEQFPSGVDLAMEHYKCLSKRRKELASAIFNSNDI